MPTPISLLVAYPKELIRAGLRVMLEKTGIKIVGETTDAPSTLALAKKHKPAVVLLDAAIPGGDAFELVGKLSKPLPATKFVFMTARCLALFAPFVHSTADVPVRHVPTIE